MSMTDQPRIVRYDEQTIEYVAWKLAERDGYRYGRGPVESYVEEVADILTALERAAELQDAGEFA